ncbi:hypothetical protein CHS0354_031967 [Potamilus streckersoni]|uniref:ERAP1-like C-terminal domain-containing protein n=1 Tax=Potamilus streckersoni TaxID=2493646 RepID=A0AAE0WG46_9BIVA|nr:hypothetical protein CHS0354_031967 [Potamilus streckersoni]
MIDIKETSQYLNKQGRINEYRWDGEWDISQCILSPADRSGLIDDAFNLARAGYIDYELALGMTSYLDTEMDYAPWKSAAEGLNFISRMLSFTPHFGLWQRYISSKASPILAKIGNWSDTGSHLQKLLRSQIIELACGNGNDECLDTANAYFQAWIRNTSCGIPPNLRSAVYTYGMMRSEKVSDWDFLWNRYLNEAVPQEKIKLLYGLAQTKETWLLVRFIEYAKDEDKVRSQDFWTVLTYISQNPVGRGLVWNWIQDNWIYMVKRFTLYSRYFGRLIPSVVSDFNTRFQLEQVKDFFAKYPEAGAGSRGRQQALESIEANIVWMETNKEKIVNWLQKTVK